MTRSLAIIFSALLAPAAAQAINEIPYRVGPTAAALGNAGRAAVDPVEAGWLNPAALVHVRSYHVSFSHQQSSRENGGAHRDFALMLADGGEDRMASGSLSYVQRKAWSGSAAGLEAEQKDIQLSAAAFIPSTRFSLGFTYRRLMHQQPAIDIAQDTFSLGALVPVANGIGIGFVGNDLAGATDDVPIEARLIPTFGVGFHMQTHSILHVRADLVRPLEGNTDGRNNVHVGLESWFDQNFAFRVGSAWLETRNETWLSAGIGFRGPRLSFGYAFEKETRSQDGTRHTIDLWTPL